MSKLIDIVYKIIIVTILLWSGIMLFIPISLSLGLSDIDAVADFSVYFLMGTVAAVAVEILLWVALSLVESCRQ